MCALKYNPEAFLPEAGHRICIFNTDITEPELLIRLLAADTARKYPDAFRGDSPQVFYRMKYIRPDEKFQEIQKLILQIKSATGIRARFKGIIAIDVSEYIGHETEEYFIIFLKYLYDNTHGCKTVLVCSQYSEKEINRLTKACLKYFTVQHEQLIVYEAGTLVDLLNSEFQEHQLKADNDSTAIMADVLCSEDLYPFRTLQLIRHFSEEIYSKVSSGKKNIAAIISPDIIREYFLNSQSAVCALAGHALLTRKEARV